MFINYWVNVSFINWYYWTQLRNPYYPFMVGMITPTGACGL